MKPDPQRLVRLEQAFLDLENDLDDSPEKQALSVLHGMIQELQRSALSPASASGPSPARGDVLELHRSAPPMNAPAVSTPLAVGTTAPDFSLPDAQLRPVRLSQFRGQPVALVFYPLDWSPGCSQQLDLYQSEIEEFRKRGVQLIAVSVDSHYSHGAWATVRSLEMPLLADFQPKGEVARQYRVYRERDGYSDRAVYVIDAEGTIRGHQLAPFLHHIPDLTELFEMLDRVAATEVHA
jgi:peroxiredoxin